MVNIIAKLQIFNDNGNVTRLNAASGNVRDFQKTQEDGSDIPF
jgi:hypothetical protein